mgnify:CR=1 FL=1
MAQIRSKPFGVTKQGANVTEYILSNPGGLTVSVLDYGCIIKNIIVPAKNGPALVATGKTRMRPILMTTLTTVLAMLQLVFSGDMASQLMSGMAIVIICGLSYATLMTLYIVPILYDIMFKKPPLNVDVGSDDELDDIPDDAAEYLAAQNAAGIAQPEV